MNVSSGGTSNKLGGLGDFLQGVAVQPARTGMQLEQMQPLVNCHHDWTLPSISSSWPSDSESLGFPTGCQVDKVDAPSAGEGVITLEFSLVNRYI
jgi:hypothetical protein